MCFAPWVSLTTAILEFIVAGLLLFYYRKSFFTRTMSAFVFLLGFYQLTEFFLCTTNSVMLWARLGFLVYTLLPALGLYFALRHTRHHPGIYLTFLPALFFILIGMFDSTFVISAGCTSFFVIVRTILFPPVNIFLSLLYGVYYLGFVIASAYLIRKKYIQDKNKLVKEEDWFIFLAASVTLFSPILLVLILPSLFSQFPSLYCQFAILIALFVLIAAEIDRKRQKLMHRKRR